MNKKTVNVSIPVTLIRKLSVYRDLTAKPKDIDAAFLIESIVNEKLLSMLGLGASAMPVTQDVTIAPEEAAEGLGDMVSPEDEASEKKEISSLFGEMDKRGAITDADLERDMQVDDPTKEAKSDATGFRLEPDQDPEEAFDFVQPKGRGKRRGAKVTMMTEMPGDVS